MSRTGVAVFVAALLGASTAAAESPGEFARRIEKDKAVQAAVNLRDDGRFGSLSIGVQPRMVADRAALDPLLAEIGKFAAGAKLKVDVLSPTQGDAEHIAARLTQAGVKKVNTRVMAAGVSIQITRIFLTPDAPASEKPQPGTAPTAPPQKR
jgi:hypothetical protein